MKVIEKNQIIPLSITALSNQGSGIGRYEGMVVFVPNSAPGDQLEVKITHVQKNHAFGAVKKILTPSQDREENTCPSYPACGGCSLRHIRYEAECEAKHGFIQENLARIGGLTPQLDSFLPSPVQQRYRNKVQLPVRNIGGKTVTGFFAPRSHDLIPMEDCLLQPEIFSLLSRELCQFMDQYSIPAYDEVQHTGLVRHLYLRYGESTGEIMASVVINGRELPHWEELLQRFLRCTNTLTTLLLNHNTKKTNVITSYDNTVLYGKGTITDTMLGTQLELSPDSFYQINYQATEKLYQQAREYANPTKEDVLLDLYCGVGSIGLTMAKEVKELIGVEIVPEAVDNATQNALRNGITNARFITADAGKASNQLRAEGLRPTIIIVDPPRKGVEETALQAMVEMNPDKIIYISCNSATLARDCKYLAEQGYEITAGRGVDLFPRTPHVESVLRLEKRK